MPQVQPAAQGGKLLGFDRTDLLFMPAVTNMTLRIEATRQCFSLRKILQCGPQQRFWLIAHRVMPQRKSERVVRNQVDMDNCQIVAVNIQQRPEFTPRFSRQQCPAIHLDTLQFAEFFADQAMVGTALRHRFIQGRENPGIGVHQPLGQVTLHHFQGFKVTESGFSGV